MREMCREILQILSAIKYWLVVSKLSQESQSPLQFSARISSTSQVFSSIRLTCVLWPPRRSPETPAPHRRRCSRFDFRPSHGRRRALGKACWTWEEAPAIRRVHTHHLRVSHVHTHAQEDKKYKIKWLLKNESVSSNLNLALDSVVNSGHKKNWPRVGFQRYKFICTIRSNLTIEWRNLTENKLFPIQLSTSLSYPSLTICAVRPIYLKWINN